jgi:hypothetical protein
MEEISAFPAAGMALVIGVGSGVELVFMGALHGGDAYDLSINPFARRKFPGWSFVAELYRPAGRRYGTVYAIGLLEHLEDPYAFLSDCCQSVALGGRIIVTIETNVPQFDHRFNFVSEEDFEKRAAGLGLTVEYKRVIPHAYARTEIGARTGFYVFKKSR